MYQSTDLVDLGKATAVILGIVQLGTDPDGAAFPQEQEFEADDFEL